MPAEPTAPPAEVESVREGSRWRHAPPSEEGIREWFDSQHLHPGMTHAPYVSGLVLIGAKEKVNRTRRRNSGDTYVQEVEEAVFVPYVKVDTRIAYFRDYVRMLNGMAANADNDEGDSWIPLEFGDYFGVIRPVPQREITDESSAYFNGNLPEGYSVYAVRNNDDPQGRANISRYLVATFEAAIYKRSSGDKPDQLVARGRGSKQTPMKRQYADDNAIMKAETGAIGRALGVLGMLVIGTGVATAEDVQEAVTAPPGNATGTTGPAAATLPRSDVTTPEMIQEVAPPPDVAVDAIGGEEMTPALELPNDDQALRELAVQIRTDMQRRFPNTWAQYVEWWQERGHPTLEELEGPALRGVVIKLQRDMDERVQAGQDFTKAAAE